MASTIAKKQEEWNMQKVRELLRLPENKKCFDCPTKSPFFVNISIQTFVCTRCSGLVREVGHRVKSISASKFSGPEIVALQHGGNEVARTIWLSNYNMSTTEPETDGDVRLFMRQKYYEQKWLDRNKGIAHAEKVKRIISELYTEDGTRRAGSTLAKRANSLNVKSDRPKIVPTESWVDDNVPIGLISSLKASQPLSDLLINNDFVVSPKSPTIPSPLGPSSSTAKRASALPIASPQQIPAQGQAPTQTSVKDDIFSELAALSPVKPVATPTYGGGILQPNSPSSPSNRNNVLPTSPSSFHMPTPTSPAPMKNNNTITSNTIDLDPYAALRDLSIGSKPVTPTIASNPLKIKTIPSDNSLSFGDFQKSPTFGNTTNSHNSSARQDLFRDLDPLFNK